MYSSLRQFSSRDTNPISQCTWKREKDQCDRCIDHGIQCRLPRPATSASSIEVKGESARASTSETEPTAPTAFYRNRLNCDTCRRHHQTVSFYFLPATLFVASHCICGDTVPYVLRLYMKCNDVVVDLKLTGFQCRPVGRKWPQKCERCIEKGFVCGPPQSKQDYERNAAQEDSKRRRRARRSTAGTSSQQQQASQSHTNGMLMLIDPNGSDYAQDGEERSDLSDHEQEPSIFVGGRQQSPAKRQRTDNADEGRARGAAAVAAMVAAAPNNNNNGAANGRRGGGGAGQDDLQTTIHTMEEEFQEVLRTEQERHDAETRTIKAKYEQELAQQRERYEGRIDDLIKIMKSIGRVD